MVKTERIALRTQGHADTIDITHEVAQAVQRSGLRSGIVTIFTPGSTCGLTTLEYEPGAVADLKRVLDEIVPPDRDYEHHKRWGDDNGHSHIRSALVGCSITIPFVEGRLTLGTWQQVIFLDFDTHPRRRELVVQILGE
ncbi:MAG: secondary thiamine-phosphate synthase enzyme YjbQ [Anaerolineae bacterium]